MISMVSVYIVASCFHYAIHMQLEVISSSHYVQIKIIILSFAFGE